jgi:hypothetical protein
MFRMVPLGLFHIFFNLNSEDRDDVGLLQPGLPTKRNLKQQHRPTDAIMGHTVRVPRGDERLLEICLF